MKLGPNFDAPLCGFQVNWPILLLLSRPQFVVATSVVSVMSHRLLFGRDMSLEELMSRQLNVVATFWSLQWLSRPLNNVATSFPCFYCRDRLMMSRLQVFSIDVATARCCLDLLFSATDVATIK